jgi:hypothetical protein
LLKSSVRVYPFFKTGNGVLADDGILIGMKVMIHGERGKRPLEGGYVMIVGV